MPQFILIYPTFTLPNLVQFMYVLLQWANKRTSYSTLQLPKILEKAYTELEKIHLTEAELAVFVSKIE